MYLGYVDGVLKNSGAHKVRTESFDTMLNQFMWRPVHYKSVHFALKIEGFGAVAVEQSSKYF